MKHPKKDDSEETKTVHQDVSLADLRYAFDHLTRQNYIFDSPKPSPYYIRKEGAWFKAVKITCKGDMKFEGKNKYNEALITRRHPLFRPNAAIHSVSKNLGFPLLVTKVEPDPEWADSPLFIFDNMEACFCMLDTEIGSK